MCVCADCFFTFNVYQKQGESPWIAQLVLPYLVFVGVACVVSLFTFGTKGKLLIDKFRWRHAASNGAAELHVETLEDKLHATQLEIRKIYCMLLLGAAEGAYHVLFVLTSHLDGWTTLCA
jgi:hypothetical protein